MFVTIRMLVRQKCFEIALGKEKGKLKSFASVVCSFRTSDPGQLIFLTIPVNTLLKASSGAFLCLSN